MRDEIRKDIQKIERELHSEIFRLSDIPANREHSMEAMSQLCKMQNAVYSMMNLIETMECNEKEEM